MSLFSVNTNSGAAVALQSLGAINRDLSATRNRISTGQKIASAKDNGAVWAIAQEQRSASRAYGTVLASLQRGQSAVDVGMAAGEAVSGLLVTMKEKMLATLDASLTATSRLALSQDYRMLWEQIDRAVASADFNGLNLVGPAGVTNGVKALADTSGSATINIDPADLSSTGAILAPLSSDLTTSKTFTDIAKMNTAIDQISVVLGRLGTGAKALESHFAFISKAQDALEASVGRLVDADLAKESAQLQSMQVKQQLALQGLSIANRAPTLMLRLFGG